MTRTLRDLVPPLPLNSRGGATPPAALHTPNGASLSFSLSLLYVKNQQHEPPTPASWFRSFFSFWLILQSGRTFKYFFFAVSRHSPPLYIRCIKIHLTVFRTITQTAVTCQWSYTFSNKLMIIVLLLFWIILLLVGDHFVASWGSICC